MKTIPVDVRRIERASGLNLHEFEEGHTYPLAKLMNVLHLAKSQRLQANTKQENTPVRDKDQTAQEHSERNIPSKKRGGQ
jgi:hypothetical protein